MGHLPFPRLFVLFVPFYVCEWGIPAADAAANAAHSVLLRNRGAAAPGQFENATADTTGIALAEIYQVK